MILTHLVLFSFLDGGSEIAPPAEPDYTPQRGFMKNLGRMMGT